MKSFNVEIQGYVVVLAENQDDAASKVARMIADKADFSQFMSVVHAAERRPEMGYQPVFDGSAAIPPGEE